MKKRLTLYSNTFLWIKDKKGLIYNADRFNSVEFSISPKILKLCNSLTDYDNLYSVKVDMTNLSLEENNFIELVTENKFGLFSDLDSNSVSLPPLLNLQSTKVKLSYISALTIFLGGKCKDSEYYKQSFYPYNSKEQLDSDKILNFINSIGIDYLKQINVIISNVLEQEYLSGVMQSLLEIKENLYIYLILSDENKEYVSSLIEKYSHQYIFICETEALSKETIAEFQSKGKFNFIIRSNNEYAEWKKVINTLSIEDYDLIPIYDNNLDFFEENVLLNKEDLKNIKLSKREVFANMSVNTNFFGDIIVLPDGKLYSNVNYQSIGTINDSIYDIISNEIDNENAWRLIRNAEPCSSCLYQWLCPSPSNYELIIEKLDLCLPLKSNKEPSSEGKTEC